MSGVESTENVAAVEDASSCVPSLSPCVCEESTVAHLDLVMFADFFNETSRNIRKQQFRIRAPRAASSGSRS